MMRHFLITTSTIMAILILFVDGQAHANEKSWVLDIQPKKCVTLRQGQICYQDVDISWYASINDNYCLYIEKEDKPVRCWQKSTKGHLSIEFQGEYTQKFLLRKEGDQKNLASTILEVKWVYKNQRNLRTGWRMF